MNIETMKSGMRRATCFFLGHKFSTPELHFDRLHFCQRGCGHEIAGRSIDELNQMPSIDPSEIDYEN